MPVQDDRGGRGAARQLRLSRDEVDGIMGRAVRRGLARRQMAPPRRIGADETSSQKRHEYVTAVTDLDRGVVPYVADDRKKESLDAFFEGLGSGNRETIEVVCMDMWQPYINSTRRHVPDADSKIAFDEFHVVQHLGDAVDHVRRQEHETLRSIGDGQLVRTRYLWLENPERMSEERWIEFQPLRDSTLKTARAWAIKELAMTLWGHLRRGWAVKAWRRWPSWAKRCRLAPVKKMARTIERHLWGMVNAIVLRTTNAAAEGMNSRIQRVQRMACGFRHRERFRNAIYSRCGGLDLYPASISRS